MIKTERIRVKQEVMMMEKAMKIWAEKMMARTHKAVKIYQLESQKKQDMTLAHRYYAPYLITNKWKGIANICGWERLLEHRNIKMHICYVYDKFLRGG